MSDWLENLRKVKDFWIARYNDCENPTQQERVRENFAHALAKYYGGNPTDKDIIEEVNFELSN
jgi:hypothetical protein